MITNLEKKHSSLKKKLESLNFLKPLSLESTALVINILNELIRTSEAYQKLKTSFNSISQQLESEKQVTLPLRNENKKLVQENNNLHKEMVVLKEDFHKKEQTSFNELKKLQDEKEDVRYLLIQKESMVSNLETESFKLRSKLNETLQKVYSENLNKGLTGADTVLNKTGKTNKPSSSSKFNNNTRAINFIGKRQEMDMTKSLESNSNFNYSANNETLKEILVKPYTTKVNISDDLKRADERCLKFLKDMNSEKEKAQEYLSKIGYLEKQIQNRDLELERLSKSYNIKGNIDDIKIKYKTDNLELQLEKLNSQIDFLNKENHRLEERLKYYEDNCSDKRLENLEKNS